MKFCLLSGSLDIKLVLYIICPKSIGDVQGLLVSGLSFCTFHIYQSGGYRVKEVSGYSCSAFGIDSGLAMTIRSNSEHVFIP